MARLHYGRKMIRLWDKRFELETKMAIKYNQLFAVRMEGFLKSELNIQLSQKVTARFLFRRINLSAAAFEDWKENRVYILPHLRAWKRLNKTFKRRQNTKNELLKMVRSAKMMIMKSKNFD